MPLFSFYTNWKHEKKQQFSVFRSCIERDRNSHQRCSFKKSLRKIHKKTPVPEPLFNKFAGQRPATLLIKRLWHRCSWEFCVILKKTLFQNTPRRVLVINGLQSIKTKQHRGVFYKKATSKSWTRTLKNLGSENLDPEKPWPRKTWTLKHWALKNLDHKNRGKQLDVEKWLEGYIV